MMDEISGPKSIGQMVVPMFVTFLLLHDCRAAIVNSTTTQGAKNLTPIWDSDISVSEIIS